MSAEGKSPTETRLRMAIQGGGCSGFQYHLTFEEEEKESDIVEEFGEIKTIIDSMTYMYTEGIVIDYIDGLEASGFKIINPAATGHCGCGKSFST